MLELGPLGGPHLMLADARRHDELALGDRRKLLEHVLGQDQVVAVRIGHRVAGSPLVDLLVPLAPVAGGDPGVDRLQERLDVGVNRYMCEFVFVDFGGVDVDVDDRAVLGKLAELAGDAVVEPHAEGQQQIGVVDGVIGVDGPVHSQHVEREVVIAGYRAQAVYGHRHGNARPGGELAQLFGRIRGHDAAAAVDDRPSSSPRSPPELLRSFALRAAAAAGNRASPWRRRSPGWQRSCSERPWERRSAPARAGPCAPDETPHARSWRCPWRPEPGNGAW